MKLILPEQITATQYAAYLKDWGAERIVPIASANPKNLPFEEWRRESIQKRTRVPEGFVNETLYFLTDDNETKLFGAVDIRRVCQNPACARAAHCAFNRHQKGTHHLQ